MALGWEKAERVFFTKDILYWQWFMRCVAEHCSDGMGHAFSAGILYPVFDWNDGRIVYMNVWVQPPEVKVGIMRKRRRRIVK